MKNHGNKEEFDANRLGRKVQRGDTKKQRAELADTLLTPVEFLQKQTKQLALATYDVLAEEFGDTCDMYLKERGGFFKVCMNKKNTKEKSTPQIEITVTKDFKFNIHLNDYKHYEDFYYHGDHLTTNELMAETRNFKAFLDDQGMSENTKLEKIDYFNQTA